MKKTRSLFLAGATAALAAVIAIGGSLAYYTDRDAATNVFTTGNVDIELTEDFEQGAELVPGVDINKDVQITNTGKNDAWVWYTYAVPTTLIDQAGDASKNSIHFNLEGDYWDAYASEEQKATGKTWHYNGLVNDQIIDDSGIKYTVVTMLYNTTLAVGETTPVSLTNVYMDIHVDIDPDGNMYWVENGEVTDLGWNVNTDGNPKVLVAAYAIQAQEFATVQEAYAAYGTQWGENGGVVYPEITVVTSLGELEAALEAGAEDIYLGDDIVGNGESSIVVPATANVTIDLNGNTITNAVAGAPAIVNNGTLTITGDGAIVNGTNNANKSHTIRNYGNLTINGGNIGTDDTAGAAIVNDGTAIINGGTFASKQENVKSDGLCAYVFINNGTGTMTINDANFNGQTHGLFGAYAGEIIVNGGNYTMDGNGGLGCYVVYASGEAKVTLNGGTISTTEPRSNRVFYVYDNGNYFNAAAVETGCVVVNGATIYLNGVEQSY